MPKSNNRAGFSSKLCDIICDSRPFFVLNTPFKNTDFGGFSMFLQAMSIPLFMTGVPLFLLLTGYLNINKTVSKRYYKGCIRVLASYFLFSLLTILFRKYYLQEDLTWAKWILKIFDFRLYHMHGISRCG